jgi:cytoskeletal protein CcmA (bactofilin family)
VVGDIHAEDELELLESSRVSGDIKTNRLSIAPGAIVNGKITMGKSEN